MSVRDKIEPLAFIFADDGLVPNNPMPFLVYKGAVALEHGEPEADNRKTVRRQWLGRDVAQRRLRFPALSRDRA